MVTFTVTANSSNGLKLYVDGARIVNPSVGGGSGALHSLSTVGSAGYNNNNPLKIGAEMRLYWYYAGILDDIRIYNRALSAAEIAAIYNATK